MELSVEDDLLVRSQPVRHQFRIREEIIQEMADKMLRTLSIPAQEADGKERERESSS